MKSINRKINYQIKVKMKMNNLVGLIMVKLKMMEIKKAVITIIIRKMMMMMVLMSLLKQMTRMKIMRNQNSK